MKPKQQKTSAMSKDAAKALFSKLIRESETLDDAWRAVRRAFPRKQYGKVRDIARAFSEYKTFTAAFNALHKRAKAPTRRAA